MRRLGYVVVCLAVMAGGFLVPAPAPAGPGLVRRPVQFTVYNTLETRGFRIIVGYRYDPPGCKPSTVLLLQHGLSYTKEAWDFPGHSWAQPLAEAGYSVVAIDRLGYGQSKLENGYLVSSEAYADMSAQIVDQLRQEFAHVVLVGHSAGAEVTELDSATFGNVDAIAVLGYHHRPSDELGKDVFTGDVPRSFAHDFEYFLGTPEHRSDMFFSKEADPAVVAADQKAAQLTPSGEMLSISNQPSGKVLWKITVPVFMQLSDADRLFEVKYADLEKSFFSSARSVTVDIVPGAGHTFQLHPSGRQATEHMINWLHGLPGAPVCH
jgi:pimeloyl-ACP methyl ester carboxylesterase